MYRKVLGCLSFVIGVAFASEAYPPTNYIIQGQYVTVDGQKLWAEKYGSGKPVIVLLNGAGDTVREWNSIIPALAKASTIAGFDYPGLGQSVPLVHLNQTYTAEEAARDLHEVLKALNVSPPYILVGHSIGGLYISYFARRYPNEVAGIIMIDGNTVENVDWNTLNTSNMPTGAENKVALFSKEADDRSKALQQQDNALLQQKDWSSSETQELANNLEVLGKPESVKEIESIGSLPHVPLIALSAGTHPSYDLWHESIKQFADQVPCSIFQVVPNSGHYIQIDQPQIVIKAVKDVINAFREGQTLCGKERV